MNDHLQCWKCGHPLAGVVSQEGKITRAEMCPQCRADLHVCKLCTFYDTRVAHACREPVAEPVTDKERANFCGYFKAKGGVYTSGIDKNADALNALHDLFSLK